MHGKDLDLALDLDLDLDLALDFVLDLDLDFVLDLDLDLNLDLHPARNIVYLSGILNSISYYLRSQSLKFGIARMVDYLKGRVFCSTRPN